MWLFFPTSATYSWGVGDEKTDQKSTKNIKIIKGKTLQSCKKVTWLMQQKIINLVI